MKRVLLILALTVPAFGQQSYNYVASTGNVVLAAATTAATLQQPATAQTMVTFPVSTTGATTPSGATIYCSVACVATIARSCTTQATATAGTVSSIVPNMPAAGVTVWTASNASGCTTLRVLNIGAGQEYGVDLSKFNLATSGVNSNLHISIASMTGTVNITFFPMETK